MEMVLDGNGGVFERTTQHEFEDFIKYFFIFSN